MFIKRAFICAIIFATLFLLSCSQKTREIDAPPNVIYILADDLGYGDLSCFGQTHFSTPRIDQLAKEGMVFTQHYAGSTVCAPSRSALLTGYHTGHTPIRGNIRVEPEGQWPLPEESFTLAEMFKTKGYSTAAFGKWGLGYINTTGDPNRQGFDVFYGYNSQTLAHNYYPDHLWHNDQKVILNKNNNGKEEQYAPDLIHEHALDYIRLHKDVPFFMYYSTPIPHAELKTTEANMKSFVGRYDPEQPYEGVDFGEEGFRKGAYGSQKNPRAAYAAMVTMLDRQVGEIMDTLEEYGLEENTLVIFTSDNGPHQEGGADPEFFDSNGPYRGYKRDLFEGGIRVPMIAKWPLKIKEGTSSNHVSTFWDWMPTLADIVGVELSEPTDGISFFPTLKGLVDRQPKHPYLYWEFHELGGRQAVRSGDWKLVKYNVLDSSLTTTALYNIVNDPSESIDLAKEKPNKVQELLEIMNQARVPSEVFRFNAKTIIK
ncbi:arylsulfatase [Seonamhaeicola sp. NFXS20]|uniref:arylsulfatase n=1 Tax=Seonamhaeicola sp. NFXS20 TaxID=2816959 RepID=UPI003B8DC77C